MLNLKEMVLNIGYGSDASLDEVIRFTDRLLKPVLLGTVSLTAHDFDVPRAHTNITLAETLLCLKPEVGLEHGVVS